MNKYRNERPPICHYGFSHRSKLERSVCDLIWLQQKAGEVECLQHEATIYLTEARIRYIPDFKLKALKTGEEYYIEVKGYADQKFPLKKKLWKHYGPAPLQIWKGDYRRPYLVETIYPENGEAA